MNRNLCHKMSEFRFQTDITDILRIHVAFYIILFYCMKTFLMNTSVESWNILIKILCISCLKNRLHSRNYFSTSEYKRSVKCANIYIIINTDFVRDKIILIIPYIRNIIDKRK